VAFVLAAVIVGEQMSRLPAASVAALPQGFALVHLAEEDGTAAYEGFYRLTEEAAAAAAALSTEARVVFVEAEFFGGVGTQASVGWEHGEVAFGPRLTDGAGAINDALRWLGVSAAGAHDEFDALGLRDHDELRSSH
jgi:hypothetical protein